MKHFANLFFPERWSWVLKKLRKESQKAFEMVFEIWNDIKHSKLKFEEEKIDIEGGVPGGTTLPASQFCSNSDNTQWLLRNSSSYEQSTVNQPQLREDLLKFQPDAISEKQSLSGR